MERENATPVERIMTVTQREQWRLSRAGCIRLLMHIYIMSQLATVVPLVLSFKCVIDIHLYSAIACKYIVLLACSRLIYCSDFVWHIAFFHVDLALKIQC